MQADSTPGNRQFVKWQSGEEWFASLPESRQKAQMSFMKSPGKWKAYKDGTPLSGFIGEHVDDVFGRQIIETSLKNAGRAGIVLGGAPIDPEELIEALGGIDEYVMLQQSGLVPDKIQRSYE